MPVRLGSRTATVDIDGAYGMGLQYYVIGDSAGAHLVAALVPGVPVAVLVMRFVFARNVALWRQNEAEIARLSGYSK